MSECRHHAAIYVQLRMMHDFLKDFLLRLLVIFLSFIHSVFQLKSSAVFIGILFRFQKLRLLTLALSARIQRADSVAPDQPCMLVSELHFSMIYNQAKHQLISVQ